MKRSSNTTGDPRSWRTRVDAGRSLGVAISLGTVTVIDIGADITIAFAVVMAGMLTNTTTGPANIAGVVVTLTDDCKRAIEEVARRRREENER